MKIAIVGLGLIGGSMALDLKGKTISNQTIDEIIGVDLNKEHTAEALKLGLVDCIQTLDEACKNAQLIVLAVPVNAIIQLLPKVLDLISDQTTVTDVGSTKSEITKAVAKHPRAKRYVPAHPMAGTEFSGPSAAHRGLFKGKAAVICDVKEWAPAHKAPDAVMKVEELFLLLEMRLIYMNCIEHDLSAAYVSHLSHISSFILANTVLDKEKNNETIFDLASGGFESTVRLAKSSPEMWTPIFEQNQKFITEALDAYIDRLKLFRKSLASGDYVQTKKYIEYANKIKSVLMKISFQGGKR